MNKLLSKDIICRKISFVERYHFIFSWKPFLFRRLIKSGVLIIVWSDFPNGASKVAIYFAVLHVAAPMLETIDVDVNSFNPSSFLVYVP